MNYIKTKIITSGLLIAIILTVLCTSVVTENYERYVFFFKNSVTSKIEAEIRYVPVQKREERAVYFFKELMLGPVNHEHYPFINPENGIISCFVRNEVLHANLPSAFLESIHMNLDADEIAFLLSKNIFTNAKGLKSACIYIDGVQIYELLKNNAKIR